MEAEELESPGTEPSSIYCVPKFSDWDDILLANQGLPKPEQATKIRQELIEAAFEYSQRLAARAEQAGLELSLPPADLIKATTSIAMAGHQGVLYHPGLLRKNLYLQELCTKNKIIGINLIIDLDETDAGQIKFPELINGITYVSKESLCKQAGLLKHQTLKDGTEQRSIWNKIKLSLEASPDTFNANMLDRVQQLFQRFAGQPIAEINSLVRSLSEPQRSYLELPLSTLVTLPSVRSLLLTWCRKAATFAAIYNKSLLEHRIQNKIKNTANPFPDLATQGARHELPFWLIDERSSSRSVVWAEGKTFFSSRDGKSFLPFDLEDTNVENYLSPRGAIVSLLYRGYCADLFIHGRGGQTYDTFTDRLAPQLIGTQLPSFVVASETRYLFPELAKKAAQWEELSNNKKDMISHTRDYLDRSLISVNARESLIALDKQRDLILPKLNNVQTPAERVPLGQSLKLINEEIRKIVEQCLAQEKPYESDELRKTWFTRDYPVFFFK